MSEITDCVFMDIREQEKKVLKSLDHLDEDQKFKLGDLFEEWKTLIKAFINSFARKTDGLKETLKDTNGNMFDLKRDILEREEEMKSIVTKKSFSGEFDINMKRHVKKLIVIASIFTFLLGGIQGFYVYALKTSFMFNVNILLTELKETKEMVKNVGSTMSKHIAEDGKYREKILSNEKNNSLLYKKIDSVDQKYIKGFK